MGRAVAGDRPAAAALAPYALMNAWDDEADEETEEGAEDGVEEQEPPEPVVPGAEEWLDGLQQELGDGEVLWQRVATAGSYASASDPRVLFGLGSRPAVGGTEVRWPSGRRERFTALPDRYSLLLEGDGEELDR